MTSKLRWRSKGTLALAGLLLVYALLSVKRSELKPLWFDELGTLNVASQPTLAGMFRVEPADGNPPLQYLLIRPCLHALGGSAFALRLPAMLFVGLALVGVYGFVGRRFGAAAGLLCSALLLFSRVSDYGVEARPYGLVMGLTALLLLFWQRAAPEEKRGPALAGLAITLFALVIAQPMGFLWGGVPLLAGEACRAWRTRRWDRPMLIAVLAGFSGFAITLYFGRQTQQVLSAAGAGGNHSAIALPTLGKFAEALQVQGLPPALALLLFLGAFWFFLKRKSSRSEHIEPNAAPLHEWVAVAAWALTIVVVYAFTCVVTHYFWARYIVPGVLAWFVLAAMVCGSLGRRRFVVATLVVGLCLIAVERRGMVSKTAATPQAQDTVTPSVLRRAGSIDPTEPIVIGKPFFFPETWWYSSAAMRARLHYIGDPQQAARTTDFVPEMTLVAMHRAGSTLFPPDALLPFLAEHPKFLLWHRYVAQGCWLEDYLHAQRYTLTPVASDSSGNETLYEVAAPAATP